MQPITGSHTHQVAARTSGCYACSCDRKFARADSLKRHIDSKNRVARYACRQCTPTRTFSRADHLEQHLRCGHRQQSSIPANVEPYVQEQQPSVMPVDDPQEHAITDVPGLAQLPGYSVSQLYCPMLGCLHPYGFLRQVDLNEHMIVHAQLQRDYVPHPSGPAYPNALPMSNTVSQGHNYSFQQSMNYAPMGGGLHGGNAYLNQVDEQRNNFQQNVNYELTRSSLQYGEFQMNEADSQGDKHYYDVNFFESSDSLETSTMIMKEAIC